MDYSKEEFIQLLEYKKNVMTLSKDELRKRYSSQEEYALFLEQTLRVLENECVIYLLDDSIKDKVYDMVNHFRFIYRDPNLNKQSNEIIGQLNGLSTMTNERENAVIDEYICMHEDIRLLEFDTLIGIELPKGNHVIEFKYTPRGFKEGTIISIIGIGLFILNNQPSS